MIVYYTMVTDGLAENWSRHTMARDRLFEAMKRLRSLLTEEEWDTLAFNSIACHLFSHATSAYTLLWLYDNRTVDSVLNLRTGHHILQSLFTSHSCQCTHLPQDKETRLRISLPRLRHVIQAYCQREKGIVDNCAAVGCLMQQPFGETIFPAIYWGNLLPIALNPWSPHMPERIAVERERGRRQQANAKP